MKDNLYPTSAAQVLALTVQGSDAVWDPTRTDASAAAAGVVEVVARHLAIKVEHPTVLVWGPWGGSLTKVEGRQCAESVVLDLRVDATNMRREMSLLAGELKQALLHVRQAEKRANFKHSKPLAIKHEVMAELPVVAKLCPECL